jgi:cytochrome b6-f complex iron-sulfur subunit
MSDESTKTAGGVLGRLPKWPRNALNNSVISAEQAYRQRSGLPLLTDADIEALKAGVPMPWEAGDGSTIQAPAAPATQATPPKPAAGTLSAPAVPSPAAPAPPTPPAASSGAISPEVAAIVANGKKWSKSSVAAEQARRQRKGLPPLNEAEITALLGEPAAPAATAPAPAQPATPAAAASVAAAGAPAAPTTARPVAMPPAVARTGESTRYVGSPAVGTSKAAAAAGLAATGPENTEVDRRRRRLVWSCVTAFLGAWFIAFFRFFLPRTLFEPNTVFKIGYPSDYALGVDTKWQQKYRIWVDRTPDRLFVIYARCTHLGCTPDWKPSENKFKCPCHGSGYDSEGINFEGPAPRPMDRAYVEKAPDGQILVDVSKLYSWPKGQPSHFNDGDGNKGAYLTV